MAGTVKGLTVDITATTTKFKKEMSRMNREIRNTNREVGMLKDALEIEFDADMFERAQSQAQEALEQTEEKAETLRERLAHLEETGQVDTKHYEEMQSELAKTEAKATFARKRLEEIEQIRVDHIAEQFEDLGSTISDVGSKVSRLSAVAGGLIATMGEIGRRSARAAQEMENLSLMYAMSVEEMQRWLYVAEQSGVSQQEFQNALRRTSMELARLAQNEIRGGSEALYELGITVEDAAQGMEANFERIIYALMDLEDATMQTYYANEIFGRRMGQRIIPLLAQGRDTVEELSAELSEVGYVTTEMNEALADFDDVLDRILWRFSVMRTELAVALLPSLELMADIMENHIAPAMRRVVDWFSELDESVQKTMLAVLAFVTVLGPAIMLFGKWVGLIGPLVRGMFSLSKAMAGLSPKMLAIGAVVALFGVMVAKSDDLRESLMSLFQQVAGVLERIFDDLLMPIMDVLMDIFVDLIESYMPVLEAILMAIIPLLETILDLLHPIIDIMKSMIPVWQLTLIPIKLMADLLAKILPVVARIVDMVSNVLHPVIERIFGVVETIFGYVERMIDWVVDRIHDLIDLLNVIPGVDIEIGVDDEEATATVEERVEREEDRDAVEAMREADRVGVSPTTHIEQDQRQQEFSVQIDVYTQGEDIDAEDFARRINRELAKQM